MGELVLEVHVQGGREAGLWLEEVGAKRRISLPDAFWRAFSESLREAGEGALASQVEAALQALVAARRREEARRRCMDLVYSPEEYRRCQELIREELGGQSPPAGGRA
ncbi:MAG: hypothetical protein XD60_0626 [Acetothermia bacterium 64_32]|nr:MAG: hypothetical protein XD60_0626 [Acetothermia bacterium 64_32]MBC7099165.1 hypothetical protein [Candidatus Bipolaricaulota bacterium]HAF71201.1 hypothetical protein [Candidatus Acetothermia bacterium]